MALRTANTIWLDRISLAVAFLNALVLLIILLYQWAKINKAKSPSRSTMRLESPTKWLNITAVLLLLSTMAYTIQRGLFSAYGIGNCTIHLYVATALYLLIKNLLYIFFIIRLDAAFRYSTFEFSSITFNILYILVFISYVSQLTIQILLGKGVKVYIDSTSAYCAADSPYWIRIYYGLSDLLMSIFLTTLFIRGLFRAFVKCIKKTKKGVFNHQLYKQISKISQYVTLTIVGVNTTFASLLIFGIASWFWAISLDLIINCWCIFLMYRNNRYWFKIICGPLHRSIGKCCYRVVKNSSYLEETSFMSVFRMKTTLTATSINTETMFEEDENENENENEIIQNENVDVEEKKHMICKIKRTNGVISLYSNSQTTDELASPSYQSIPIERTDENNNKNGQIEHKLTIINPDELEDNYNVNVDENTIVM
eukprot:200452_1